jgi:hypothetical protein
MSKRKKPAGGKRGRGGAVLVADLATLITLAASDRLEFPRIYKTRNDGKQYESVSRRVFMKKRGGGTGGARKKPLSVSKPVVKKKPGGDGTGGSAEIAPITEEAAFLSVADLVALQKLAKTGGLKHPAVYVTQDNGEQYESMSKSTYKIKR